MSTVSKFARLGLHIYVSVISVRMYVSLWVRLVCGFDWRYDKLLCLGALLVHGLISRMLNTLLKQNRF